MPNARGYYCGACKGTHAKQETVRKCYEDHYAAASRIQKFTTSDTVVLPSKVGEYIVQTERPRYMSITDHENIPSGNYMVLVRIPPMRITDPARQEKYLHIRVGVFPEGKWGGQYVVSIFDESKRKLVPVKDATARTEIIGKIKAGNWQMFLTSYGKAYAECPICEQPLGKDEIHSGVHKATECYSKVYGG
jgi:hypothetical protein